MTRPSDQIKAKRSWIVRWKGNTPVLEQSHWQPGYTQGHKETPQEAIAQEAMELMDSIAAFREKWLKLNLLAEQQNHQIVADAFGSMLTTDQMTITETDDPHEQMTMPEGAQTVHQASVNIPIVDPGDIDVIEGADIVEHMYSEGDVPSGLNDYPVIPSVAPDPYAKVWNHDGHADGEWSGYDDHQDH